MRTEDAVRKWDMQRLWRCAWRAKRRISKIYLVGISSAAAMVGALRVAEGLAERAEAGTVVTLFPDNAYKYLSEAFWRG